MPRLPDPRYAPDCAIVVDGRRVPARTGESVTSALLAAGRPLLSRSPRYHRPRGPFCLAGSCASCLVRAGGVPNVRACETPCAEGLVVDTQNTWGGAEKDLLGAIDVLAPRGIDPHRLGTWSRLASRVAVSTSRRLAGLGRLQERVPAPWPAAPEERFDALVVGGGPAGLGAAAALAREGARVLLCERERSLGGRLRCRLGLEGDPPLAWAADVIHAVRGAGGEIALAAAAVGLWSCASAGGEALVAMPQRPSSGEPRMRLVRAPRVVLACGTWAQPPVFEGNDLPGILGARGLATALAEDGVVPGERAVVLGGGPEARAVAERLDGAGMQVELLAADVVRARGGRRLAAVDLDDGRTVPCDTLVVATARAPAAELAREAGAALDLDPATGIAWPRAEDDGRVAPGAWAAGEVLGPCSARDAAAAGRRAGAAAARAGREAR
jgi:sarcosine oxidase subunit alpha